MLFLFACRTHGDEIADTPPYELIADTTTHALGDTAHLVFVNNSDDDVYVDFLCSTSIEMHDKAGWVEVFRRDCSQIRVRPTVVAGGESTVGTFIVGPFELHESAFADYRICTIVSHASESTKVYSPTFRIIPHQ